MVNPVFILGNGESRNNIDLNWLKEKGKVYGCNALYRDFDADALICVDGGMMHEVYASGYALEHKCYFRSFTKLPADIYPTMVDVNFFDGWGDGLRTENDKGNRNQFVLNGTDPNQIQRLYEHHIKTMKEQGKELDEIDMLEVRQLLGNHQQWITWVEDEDKVEIIKEEYGGWSAGPIAVRIALEKENPTDVFLIGFDLGSATGKVNNIYKGTSNYVTQDAKETPCSNWINQHLENFKDFPNVKFWKVNPHPLGTDGTSQFVEQWRKNDNLEYIEQENLKLVLDFGV